MEQPYFSGLKVLVAGGTGLIGIPLVQLLLEHGATVRISSRDDKLLSNPDAEFIQTDLMDYRNCLRVCRNIDYVFNLLCVKGSPKTVKEHPATFFDTLTTLNSNLARAALQNTVNGFLFTSSVAVYQPAEILYEEDVWKTQPSKNDWFAGHAKRMGELQIEAYRVEHNWTNTAIVRPSNVYGPNDNFNPDSALFMAYIIQKFAEKQSPIVLSGDGSQVRDFIHAKDTARGMILAAEKSAGPLNLCSGVPTTIKEVVNILVRNSDYCPEVIFDTTKSAGDKKRLLDVTKLKALGFEPQTNLEAGILETLDWYKSNKDIRGKRYDIFNTSG